jgi:general transcriptional corepressor TUP1
MIYSGHEQDIYGLDFAGNGRYIASGSADKSVRLWDVEAGRQILQFNIEEGVTTIAISPDGQYVAAAALSGGIWVWNSLTGYLVQRFKGPGGHTDAVYSIAFSPTGCELVSGSLDKAIKIWELALQRSPPQSNDGKCIRTLEGHKVYIIPVLFYVCMLIQT